MQPLYVLAYWSDDPSDMADSLRNKLRDARTSVGWTQAELAERVGVSRKTINTVENGIFVPSTTLALRLAAALEMSVEDLFMLAE